MRQILSDGLQSVGRLFHRLKPRYRQSPFAHATTSFPADPFFGNGRIRQRIVVLQIGTDASSRQCCPYGILNHGICLIRPDREVGRIRWELLLQAFDNILIFKEQNCRRACFKTSSVFVQWLQTARQEQPHATLLRQNATLWHVLRQQYDHSGRLRIERRRRMQNGVFDDFAYFLIGQR